MTAKTPIDALFKAWIPDPKRAGEAEEHLAKIMDPFGIGKAIVEMQVAWLTHPQDLSDALLKFTRDLEALQTHLWNVAAGVEKEAPVKAVEGDERFADPMWTELPAFAAMKQYYLLVTRWLQDTLYHTPGVPAKDKRKATFWVRQWLNAIAPSNYLLTNPVAIQKFFETGGESMVSGLKHWLDDLRVGDVQMVERSGFQVGRNLAATPGAVVFRNELLEVIHYAASTEKVREIPIVIVAPWINKFYILDLNPRKSLVRYLTDQGFSVFITSWKNPGPSLANTTFDDYLLKGVLQAIEVAREICGAPRVHAVGYCLGGTTLAALMAWLNREHEREQDVPVAHWTLFTTLVDFSRPGAIEVFIDEDSIEGLEEVMRNQGYLDGRDMGRAFRMLRSNSLIWYYFVHGYLYGETPPAFDVLYWNTDVTRLPAAMHGFYLREFYLKNKLIQKDAITLAGHPIDFGRIRQPLYAVGCEEDHIAPWKATYSLGGRIPAPARYTLSSSGHILGIINPPVTPPKRWYWTGAIRHEAAADEWLKEQQRVEGTWWENWVAWLNERCGELKAPPPLDTPAHPKLADAPGLYVLES